MEGREEKVFNIILIVGFISLLVVFLHLSSKNTVAIGIESHINDCSYDTDCIMVNSGCCGCDGGGVKIAINKNYIGYWNEKIFRECREVSCPAMAFRDESCYSTPRCVEGMCTLAITV